ncbi:MAG: histidinol-phosphatase HisJ family protein [Erysipelotrichaceae bacterium]|nr:histidinol-phosphatase HisJ family protein [Erysipelotrichaceae bacterium]
MIANYHTHTKWCRHAKGEAEDYIKEAIGLGLKEIAITDHVPHIDNSDPGRMMWEEFEAFNQKLDEAIEKYQDQITIYKGFECEYYPEALDFYKKCINDYGYEIMILGQHRCGKDRYYNAFSNMDETALKIYADTVCEGLKSGLFSFLAHPDVFLFSYPQWDKHAENALRQIYQTCEELKIPVEINGFGYYAGRPYPSTDALKISKEYQLTYMINTDAHRPELLYTEKTKELEQLIKDMGIEVLDYLPKERHITKAIR